ncbi:SGNH/GDSL hydrolase family protein [Streptomyces tsukubensis]|uniref:SGNH hydrolase n=1 Tax=Streptomyces tsukubensis TaxID=83656 RepID=A0A1V4AAN2_9ACTN|nr:SGNH/GDSL hydrolase family protein [Streptomyces tsukubensis]OON80127.1 SGNH hydrolase [Streptomyces tsukubensis]QFR97357.1 SGNH hydrolase [Streptomyces tsukubensis]
MEPLLSTSTSTSTPTPPPTRDRPGARVMPLGDSITDGHAAYPGGYRVALWKRLTAEQYDIDFVGSMTNGPADLGALHHEGHSGWRIDQLDAHVGSWLRRSEPHTVLLLIGTNDVNQNYDIDHAPTRLSALIDHIRAAAPHCELFVSTVPPQPDPVRERGIRSYNAAIPQLIAQKGPRVHLVDMWAALTTADLADGVHPSRAGHEKMAAAWYQALRTVPAALAPLAERADTAPPR